MSEKWIYYFSLVFNGWSKSGLGVL